MCNEGRFSEKLPDIPWTEESDMTENERTKILKLRAEGNGYVTIARKLGVSLNTVKSFCRRKKINAKKTTGFSVAGKGNTTRCENCGQEIRQVAKQKPRRFCSDKCRNQWWNTHLDQVKRKAVYYFKCKHCGKAFQVYGDRERKYCCHACYLADRFHGRERHE
jgi:DNA-binding CsgD family transcriptional regulator